MITHDYGIIFIHLPKTGGRSICNLFNQRFDHFTAEYYRQEYPTYWPRYFRFAIIRHPFDRYVSMYHYIREHRRHRHEPIFTLKKDHGYQPDFKEWLLTNIQYFQGNFSHHSPEGGRGTDGQLGSPHYFTSTVRRIGKECMPYVPDDVTLLRFEDGFDAIGTRLAHITGMYNARIVHENSSTHADWRTYWDDELITKAIRFPGIREDMDAFGYKIP